MVKRLSQFNVPFQEIIIAFFNNGATVIPANHECDKLLFPHPYTDSHPATTHAKFNKNSPTPLRLLLTSLSYLNLIRLMDSGNYRKKSLIEAIKVNRSIIY